MQHRRLIIYTYCSMDNDHVYSISTLSQCGHNDHVTIIKHYHSVGNDHTA